MSGNYEEDPGTPTHKARPSIITTASGIAESTMTYGSFMSNDGLARLSLFPPPPVGIPFTPMEAAFAGPSSPVTSDRSMTPLANPRRALPPVPSTSAPQLKQNIPRDVSSDHVSSSHGPLRSRPPLPTPPSSAAASTISNYPSPHDWHDGSSSIANDAYGEAVLSTSFITSLLSTPAVDDTPTVTAGPTSYKQTKYEPSVVSNALTTDSTITYPPPKTYPPLSSNYRYPPVPRPSPSTPQTGAVVDLSSPHALNSHIRNFMPIEGRYTPDTLVSDESSRPTQLADPYPSRAISVTPSLGSMTSSTPLINNNFPKGDPILEEDEGKISGPSTPSQTRWSRTRDRRSSTAQSTKTSKSSKSYVSSLLGRVSHSSGDRRSLKQAAAAWFRGKPLPPVPPMPDHAFREIRKAEDQIPLPDLVNRAAALSDLLDKGHRPYQSMVSLPSTAAKEQRMPEGVGYGEVRHTGADPTWMQTARARKGQSGDFSRDAWNQPLGQSPDSPTKVKRFPLTKKRKLVLGLIVIGLIIGITVGVAVGVSVGQHHSQHTCLGNLTGSACTLNATCVCTSVVGGQCTQLAQSIVDLINNTNSLFNASFTPDFVSDALWQVQGSSTSSNCAAQANLIDVAPALDVVSSPNRTTWAQAALLWNLVQSENVTAAQYLQTFVQSADWSALKIQDGPVADSSSQFSTDVLGFTFDFASQTVQTLPVTFQSVGQPVSGQVTQVGDTAMSALNRMYSFAYASSTQQSLALQHYWTSTLQQSLSDLPKFLSSIAGSPILLPFDATSAPGKHNISSLLTNSSSAPFPPPLSCYPGLSQTQTQALQELETSVFGLEPASSATTFDASCFPDRPVYGVLDILALRLPFPDGSAGVARQAALLTQDASVRAVVYSGNSSIVSALPGGGSPGTPSPNPFQYGTLSHMKHTILQYLRSIENVSTAIQLVKYVLKPAVLPPDNGILPELFTALSTLPVLEVAVFGTVNPNDIASTVSSLSDPSDNLFFGTDASLAVRNWALNATRQGMEWTELATSQQVVQDKSDANSDFTTVLNNASEFFHSTNDAIVNVSNITIAFSAFNLLKPVGLMTAESGASS